METDRPPDEKTAGPSSDNGGRTGGGIRDRVRDARDAASERVERGVSGLGRSVQQAAHRVRERIPSEGRFGHGRIHDTAERVTDRVEHMGRYLEEADFEEMAEDVTDLVRRYPLQSVLVGLGIGFLIARLRDR
jgi:ElaB/YqjD/DUF883 family membrane-anchored ribosome-binding protein